MRAYLPYMGMFTIWLNDYPLFKFAVLGLMGFFVLIAKDPQWSFVFLKFNFVNFMILGSGFSFNLIFK